MLTCKNVRIQNDMKYERGSVLFLRMRMCVGRTRHDLTKGRCLSVPVSGSNARSLCHGYQLKRFHKRTTVAFGETCMSQKDPFHSSRLVIKPSVIMLKGCCHSSDMWYSGGFPPLATRCSLTHISIIVFPQSSPVPLQVLIYKLMNTKLFQ